MRARRGLPSLKRQLVDVGALPLILVQLLRRPTDAVANPPSASPVLPLDLTSTISGAPHSAPPPPAAPSAGTRAAPLFSPVAVAAFRTLTELISDDDAAKAATFDLLGATAMLGMLRAVSAATAAASATPMSAAAQPTSAPPLTREAILFGFELCTFGSFRRVLRLVAPPPIVDSNSARLHAYIHRVRECWPAFSEAPQPTAVVALPSPRRPVAPPTLSSHSRPRQTPSNPTLFNMSPAATSPAATGSAVVTAAAPIASPDAPPDLTGTVPSPLSLAPPAPALSSAPATPPAAAPASGLSRAPAAGELTVSTRNATASPGLGSPEERPAETEATPPMTPLSPLPNTAPSPMLGAGTSLMGPHAPLHGDFARGPSPPSLQRLGFTGIVPPLHDARLLEDLLPDLIPELRSPLRSRASTATASPRAGSALGGMGGVFDSGPGLAHLSLQLPGVVGLRIRGVDAASLLLSLLSEGDGTEQQETAALLLLLLEATPANKRTLAGCASMLPLLRLLARCTDDSTGNLRIHLLRTAAALGEYTISGAEALLLFRLAAAPEPLLPLTESAEAEARAEAVHREEIRERLREELQMQLLFVIGSVAESSSPRNFFSLDGASRLAHGPLMHLPAAKIGYTLAFWIRVGAQPEGEPEVGVLQLPSTTGQKLLEVSLCLRELDTANSLKTRAIVLRTASTGGFEGAVGCAWTHGDKLLGAASAASPSAAPVGGISGPDATHGHGHVHAYRFDGCGFGECGEWHHVVLTQSRMGTKLCVDGVLIEGTQHLTYPELVSLKGSRGKSPLPPSESTRFSGQLAALIVAEGCWDPPTAARLFERGAMHTDTERSLRALGVDGRILLHVSAMRPSDTLRRPRQPRASKQQQTSSSSTVKSPLKVSRRKKVRGDEPAEEEGAETGSVAVGAGRSVSPPPVDAPADVSPILSHPRDESFKGAVW